MDRCHFGSIDFGTAKNVLKLERVKGIEPSS